MWHVEICRHGKVVGKWRNETLKGLAQGSKQRSTRPEVTSAILRLNQEHFLEEGINVGGYGVFRIGGQDYEITVVREGEGAA